MNSRFQHFRCMKTRASLNTRDAFKSGVNVDGPKYRRILRKKPMFHPGLDFNGGSVLSAS